MVGGVVGVVGVVGGDGCQGVGHAGRNLHFRDGLVGNVLIVNVARAAAQPEYAQEES